ncbi:hypothetical protein EDC02_7239 [Micromonospora sp. Llam0]|uniref:TRAFAC clade GTPase domain-containing protein n=1 Tax=Micromonospora sp. Llam0 TaxID=2485143 RepID=UPI000F471990|nr:hypothetical protein [Micromonospora sp. Llam0]ROO52317.1 hypothetical protein EDC02_7239 [Micromonospora sp. Llam0]
MFIKDDALGRVMDITMLGPRGVGKTSLLVSLYDQFQDVVGTSQLEMSVTDPATRATLQGYREDLRRFAKGIGRDSGVAATQLVRSHLFGLGTRGRPKPQMTLRFTDIPGEILNAAVADTERVMLDRALAQSSVIFLAIDSPALMERSGRYNEETNKPVHVSEFVRDALKVSGNRLVVFVPLKCEKYVAAPNGVRELSAAVRDAYQPLLQTITKAAVPCGAVLTTVQTVGSMRFSRFEPDPDHVGQFREIFRPTRIGASYAPKDNDQPVRWMLRFAVNAYKKRDKTFGEKFIDWWNDTDLTLNAAMRQFSADCKREDGFEILVNHPYLELP